MIQIEDVRTLADLARLSLSEDQIISYQKDFEGILNYIDTITKAVVTDIHSTPVLSNVVREDDISYEPGQFTQAILDNAPKVQDAYFEVAKIL